MKAGSGTASLLHKALQWSLAQREGAVLPASMLAQQYETGIPCKGFFRTKTAVYFPVSFLPPLLQVFLSPFPKATIRKKEMTVIEKYIKKTTTQYLFQISLPPIPLIYTQSECIVP